MFKSIKDFVRFIVYFRIICHTSEKLNIFSKNYKNNKILPRKDNKHYQVIHMMIIGGVRLRGKKTSVLFEICSNQ